MKSKLLSDHKQTGKIFKPPLLAFGTFIETAWLDFGVPEFVWIHVLCEEYGTDEGSLLFLEFMKVADKFLLSKLHNKTASALISSYNVLSESDKIEIVGELQRKALLPRLKPVLVPFLTLYPMCPLNFIFEQSIDINRNNEYLIKYKGYLEKFIDKKSFESTIVMANVINFLNHFCRLKVVKGIGLPEFKEILEYPKTENSKRLASFLRSAISMCFNEEWEYDRQNEWIKYFWNQSLRLEPFKI